MVTDTYLRDSDLDITLLHTIENQRAAEKIFDVFSVLVTMCGASEGFANNQYS